MLWRSVSIHASAKEATGAISAFVTTIVFQSTPPRRRRLNCILLHLCLLVVSIHASAKEATVPRSRGHKATFGFNPRLREGGDCDLAYTRTRGTVSIHASAKEATLRIFHLAVNVLVSIHASAKEATAVKDAHACVRKVSIHASAKEATGGSFSTGAIFISFNPRLREGGDLIASNYNNMIYVSIHASAKEATRSRSLTWSRPRSFNPRLREGGDETGRQRNRIKCLFQSTPPRRRRQH